MNFTDLYKILEKKRYYLFSFEDLLTFFPNENRNNLKQIIFRWKIKGWIYPLKKGFYELIFPEDLNIPDMYIANNLYRPSYISLETALSNYSIIPEVSMAVTSITTKPTRKFRNKHGLFIYHTVKPCVFMGYYVERQENFDIFIAEPEKALIDFLYFKAYRGKKIDFQEERISKEAVGRLKKKKMVKYAKLYNFSLKELHAYLR